MSTAPSTPVTIPEALQYEEDSLREGIEKCHTNITLFEDAIANERQTIERYMQMITIIQMHGKK